MALFRKLFYRKPPDGLLEICERVYVFDYCFITDAWQEENYRTYMSGIVGQLKEHFPDASFLAFNFREGETPTQLANILSEFDMTIMEYPRQYEGCPLIKMELIHHFLRSGESWLSLGQNNLLLMHCERGGWLVLAFMLAALLIYRKQYSGEQKTLDMIYRQAPRELLHLLSPLNPLPSQLRYLQYVSRRNVASEWPPLDRTVTMDCIILRFIPNFDGHGGCCPVFRIYGHAPSDESANTGCLTPRKGKNTRAYKQTECELVKIDINCRIQGDVVLECVSLNDDMEHERMMFRAVFNTAFIRSNILILNRDEIDILWDAKDQFPKDFRAEILFSEMDAADSIVAADFPRIEEKEGLTEEEFYKVHEMFNSDDWYSSDIALNVLQGASNILQEKLEADLQQGRQNSPLSPRSPQSLERSPRKRRERKKRTAFDSGIKSVVLSAQQIESGHSPKSSTAFSADIMEETKHKDIQSGLQVTIQSDKCEQPHQLSLDSTTRLLSDNVASFGSPEFYDKTSSRDTLNQNLPVDRTEPVDFSSVSFSPSRHPLGPVVNSSASNSLPPSTSPPHHFSFSKTVDPLLAKETNTYIGDKCQLSSESSQATSNNQSTMLVPPSPPIKLPIPPPLSPVGENDAIKCEPPTAPPPPTPPLKENLSVRVRPPPPPPPPHRSVQVASSTVSPLAPPPPPPPSNSSRAPSAPPPPSSAPPPPSFAPPTPAPPLSSPSSTKGRLSRTISSRSHQTKKLKPLHWLKLTRAVHGSLWEEAQKCGEASKAPEIDMSELETLFSASISSSDNGKKSNMRGSLGQKVDKVQLIEHRRAYNCEIMLSKVKVPLNTLMGSVLALEDTALDMDQLENLIKFCPTKEEMELLKGYTGEKEKLGKCEQFFLELMQVPRVESKLRVFSFKMQFHAQVSDLRNSLNVVNSTAEEIRNSAMLKKVMQTILSLGNALNQGTARGSAIGFKLDSLLKLTDTRAKNNKITLMHYLCKVLADKLPELLDFYKYLGSLEPASKIQLKFLAEEMQAISKGLEKVVQELSISESDGPISDSFRKILKEFLRFAEAEVRSLASLYSGVGRNVDALILYFGEDPARCPFEQVVSTLLNFVKLFKKAHGENCKQLENEMKKAAENEKSKLKESERLLQKPVESGSVK